MAGALEALVARCVRLAASAPVEVRVERYVDPFESQARALERRADDDARARQRAAAAHQAETKQWFADARVRRSATDLAAEAVLEEARRQARGDAPRTQDTIVDAASCRFSVRTYRYALRDLEAAGSIYSRRGASACTVDAEGVRHWHGSPSRLTWAGVDADRRRHFAAIHRARLERLRTPTDRQRVAADVRRGRPGGPRRPAPTPSLALETPDRAPP